MSVVIAHRLSTLRHMDRIIVIRRGKIVETGSHKQLLQQGGLYRRLWNMQTSGFVAWGERRSKLNFDLLLDNKYFCIIFIYGLVI